MNSLLLEPRPMAEKKTGMFGQAICTSIKTDGTPCNSLAIFGTKLCRWHSPKLNQNVIDNKSNSPLTLNEDIKNIRHEINELISEKTKKNSPRIDELRDQLARLIDKQSAIDLRSAEYKSADEKISAFVTELNIIIKRNIKDSSLRDDIYSDLFALSRRMTGQDHQDARRHRPTTAQPTLSPPAPLTNMETGNSGEGNGNRDGIPTPSMLPNPLPGVGLKEATPVSAGPGPSGDSSKVSPITESKPSSQTVNETQIGISNGS